MSDRASTSSPENLATSGGYQARHRGVPVHKPPCTLKEGCSASDAQELSSGPLQGTSAPIRRCVAPQSEHSLEESKLSSVICTVKAASTSGMC